MNASPLSPMARLDCTVRFVTPAFLGDAQQHGAWRTPPFKALLRAWWRVLKARELGFDAGRLRDAEGRLFGRAHGERFSRSLVQVRLAEWREGRLLRSQWPDDDRPFKLPHPETHRRDGSPLPVGATLYLGFGPLMLREGRTALKANAAIQAGEANTLSVRTADRQMHDVLQLIAWFGTIGGRSRNGWGSIELAGADLRGIEALRRTDDLVSRISRPLRDCLSLEWPHALGTDDKGQPLVWRTKEAFPDWRSAMRELARIKIAFRTRLAFPNEAPGRLRERHLLAYPVTNHPVNAWGRNARLANQLRFKVHKTEGSYVGHAFHFPCGLPTSLLKPALEQSRGALEVRQIDAWTKVHAVLDDKMQRLD